VTDPVRFGGKHGVFFSGASGLPDHFGPAQTMAVQGVLGADANVIKLSNLNVSSLDVDGDGTVDLLHMPFVKTFSVYSPRLIPGGNWVWQGRLAQGAPPSGYPALTLPPGTQATASCA